MKIKKQWMNELKDFRDNWDVGSDGTTFDDAVREWANSDDAEVDEDGWLFVHNYPADNQQYKALLQFLRANYA